jgi:hypothetical protein
MKIWNFGFGLGLVSVFAQSATADSDCDTDSERLGCDSIFGTERCVSPDTSVCAKTRRPNPDWRVNRSKSIIHDMARYLQYSIEGESNAFVIPRYARAGKSWED